MGTLARDNSRYKLIKHQSSHHAETSQLICRGNQLNGFYMVVTLAFNQLMALNGFINKIKNIPPLQVTSNKTN